MTRYAAPTTESPDGADFAFAQESVSDGNQPVWPPLHALMTVSSEAKQDQESRVCAVTPVPFQAKPMNPAEVPGAALAPAQKPAPPEMATVRIKGSELCARFYCHAETARL